jgi:hypothetical protein
MYSDNIMLNKPRVRVFTRSVESCKEDKPYKPLMQKFYKDKTLHITEGFTKTYLQKNYFYDLRC